MMSIIIRCACILFFMQAAYKSSGANQEFIDLNAKAQAAFDKKNYEEAILYWTEIVNKGNSDPDLFYNTGLAESLLGYVPEAIFAYEKALRYQPFSATVRDALKREREKITEAVIPINQFILFEWGIKILSICRPGTWAYAGLVSLLFAVVMWLSQMNLLRLQNNKQLPRPFPFIITGIVFLLIALLAYRHIHRNNEAIIFSVCELQQGPSTQSPRIMTINAGEKIFIKDNISGWYRVHLLNLDEGWIKDECARIIHLH